MNSTLFKATAKANWIILLVITLVILMYTTISITMFDPDNIEKMNAMLDMVPEGMLKAMGFENLGTDLTNYLSNYLYGFIFIMFPMIYCIIVSNKLIAKHVDSGSMAYLLTTPNSRVTIAATQALFLISGLAIIFTVNIIAAVTISESMFKGLLDIGKFLSLNWITYLVLTVIAGIGFLSSCIFNDTKNSLAFGAGIPIGFFVIKMISEISTELEWLKYLSIYSFIDVDTILENSQYVTFSSLFLIILIIALYFTAIIIFNRRSLSI